MSVKNKRKPLSGWLKALIVVFAIAVLVVAVFAIDSIGIKPERELSVAEAQEIVDANISSLPKVATIIVDSSRVKVNSVKKDGDRRFSLDCTYETKNIGAIIEEKKNELFSEVYAYYIEREASGTKTSGTNIRMKVATPIIKGAYDSAETITGNVEIAIYQMNDGNMKMYLSYKAVNTCYGGVLDALKLINDTKEIAYEDEIIDITNLNTLRTGISDCFAQNDRFFNKSVNFRRLQKAAKP